MTNLPQHLRDAAAEDGVRFDVERHRRIMAAVTTGGGASDAESVVEGPSSSPWRTPALLSAAAVIALAMGMLLWFRSAGMPDRRGESVARTDGPRVSLPTPVKNRGDVARWLSAPAKLTAPRLAAPAAAVEAGFGTLDPLTPVVADGRAIGSYLSRQFIRASSISRRPEAPAKTDGRA